MDFDEKLISKKQLLAKYGISYGALYRWKRKGLIPDEWFIKKSVSTGQETFFPEKLICERIELIKEMKDDVLLDELAEKLSGKEKKETYITLSTEYGSKSFRMQDVKGIFLVGKYGVTNDITDTVNKLFEDIDSETENTKNNTNIGGDKI